jgi:hypothetical protein
MGRCEVDPVQWLCTDVFADPSRTYLAHAFAHTQFSMLGSHMNTCALCTLPLKRAASLACLLS